MKHVEYFLGWANDVSITAKYSAFLGSQCVAVYHNAMNAAHDVGSVWYAPNQGGSQWGPQPSASGLEAVLSAAKVRLTTMGWRPIRTTHAIYRSMDLVSQNDYKSIHLKEENATASTQMKA